jgi:hypothetical protein
MDARPFGARFVDEMRRLTRSTWGMEYQQLQRMAQMNREEFRAAFGGRLGPLGEARGGRDRHEPEQLARAIVEQGRSSDMLSLVLSIMSGLA